MATTKMLIDDDDIDLEDDQFKRARLDTSIFPHYELQSKDMNDDDDIFDDMDDDKGKNKRKKKGTDDFFYASYDSNDNTGDFPFEFGKKENDEMQPSAMGSIKLSIDQDNNDDKKLEAKEAKHDNNNDNHDEEEEVNPLFVYNYWLRYHELTLNWPTCDGKCGNKFGRLIHNEVHGIKDDAKENKIDDISVLYIDNYQLNGDDLNSIKVFSNLNPMNIQSEMVIQMWSYLDNLKSRIQEHNEKMTEIAHEKKVHEIINKDIETTLNVKEIISKEFLCYSTSIRRYLLSLLDSFEENNGISSSDENKKNLIYYRFLALYKLLKDKENIICDDKPTLDVWSRLTTLKQSKHYFILYQLSRYSCYNQTNTLFKELKQNGYHTISPMIYTKQMVRIIKTPQYSIMKRYNLELTAEEIISILIYTGTDQISKRVRESFIMEQRGCKWTKLQGHLISAVDKMHKFLVQTKRKEHLPERLYYAIGASISKKRCQYFDILSATANVNLAKKFMQKGTMIIFDKSNEMLQKSRFVAAPLNWITSRGNNKNYSEWLVCCVKIHDSIKKKLDGGNSSQIICTDYETINFRSMETWRSVVDASMLLQQTNQSLAQASNSAILNMDTWRCVHCQNEIPIYYYQGNILFDNLECPNCRRYNLFSFNVPERIVPCYNCGKESMLKEYIMGKKGAICPECKQPQLEAFKNSPGMELMKKYMSVDNGFKSYQTRMKQLTEEQKKQYMSPSYPTIGSSINGYNPTTGTKIEPKIEASNKKKNSKGGFFRGWGKSKKSKAVKSSNLNDIQEDPSIIEDGFD